MPTLELDGRLIYFAHCPKAGGTSVERFMVDRWGDAVGHLGWGWDRQWAGRGERAVRIACSPQHYVWEDARGVLPRQPDHVFTVVRDPVARLVSEFRYQRSDRLTGIFGRPVRRLSFPVWLRLMFEMADRNPYTHDNHFRPQSAFMPETGVTVFRLENGLGEVLRWLCRFLGEAPPATLPHDLKASDGAGVAPSAEDRALIAQRYAGDYRRFGYPMPEVVGVEGAEPARVWRRRAIRTAARALDPLYRCGHV
jgi:hypothetical protein